MFRIRRIYDDILPRDRQAVIQVQAILRSRFNALDETDIQKLPLQLRDPLKYRFRSILFVAEDQRGDVKGFALMHHAPDRDFCFLDFLSVESGRPGRGVGGALYERVREAASELAGGGLFFECLPDDPALCRNRAQREQNKKRLRFYEQYGAFPIINTAYETPFKPGGDCPPYLVFDSLGRTATLSAARARNIFTAILQRKYGASCPPGYIERVASSVTDDPLRLRPPKYRQSPLSTPPGAAVSIDRRIALVVSDAHDIHHIHDRGYVEAPVRINRILEGIKDLAFIDRLKPDRFNEKHITAVHNRDYVGYLKRMCSRLPPDRSVYPSVFPGQENARPPKEMPDRAGYYCMDTFTPLTGNAYPAAKRAIDCALTASTALLEGYRLSYALVRPPGHHAGWKAFGGFCYFNSAAVAAHYLSAFGRVAALDIDYHHGRGTQDIFYERPDVLTISIHGHPGFAYPNFSGFPGERGSATGKGFNVNYALPEQIDGNDYRDALQQALKRITRFRPRFLIVALGFDTARGDPTGTWHLISKDFHDNGRLIGAMHLPTLIVQEGGYFTRSLGINARHFLVGLWEGSQAKGVAEQRPQQRKTGSHRSSRSREHTSDQSSRP